MHIVDLFEHEFQGYISESAPRLVVIYPGRFQPFHLGHREVFESLQHTFGRDNVFIATSNKTEIPKSPFNFNDKLQLMISAGIPADKIIEVTSPYKLPSQFDPKNTIFVVAVGEPDRGRLSPDSVKRDGTEGYFKTFTKIKDATTADKHGYVIIANERKKQISIGGNTVDVSHGTQTREVWNSVRNNPKQRAEFLLQMYGRNDAELGRILDKIPAGLSENIVDPELANTIDYAVGHYPNIKDRGTAFMKFVQRSLKHGLETDIDQQKKINNLTVQIEQLKKQIASAKIDENSKSRLTYIGNCTNDDVIENIFGDATHFAQAVEEYGDEFSINGLVVKYDPNTDIHSFYYKKQDVAEEAAGVGVVKNSRDPRYVMATMGDQNDVTAATLPKMMRGYHLTGKAKK